VLVDRANYGRLLPVISVLKREPSVELSFVLGGSMVLPRFGHTDDEFSLREVRRLYHSVEGNVPRSQVQSIALGVSAFANAFAELAPDFVIIIGDRFEALSAAIAASYTELCVVHVQGGEVSRTIDDRTRHSITKLSHYHVPATATAAERIVSLGEPRETILTIGCPGIDVCAPYRKYERCGEPIWIAHPDDETDWQGLLATALSRWPNLSVWWPNIDARSDEITKAIRRLRVKSTVKNMDPDRYCRTLAATRLAIGNSSSFVREGSYLGTPVCLLGSRQDGREIGPNVIARTIEDVPDEIPAVIGCDLYGDGNVAKRVVKELLGRDPYTKKENDFEIPTSVVVPPLDALAARAAAEAAL
jgi:UDP-N-acetylglucosamine 2-epimerase